MNGIMKDGRRRSLLATITMPLLALLWTVPTIGLLVTSFRSREAAASTGWWTSLWEGGWTLDNYATVLGDPSISGSLVNSIVVAVPATVLPIMFGRSPPTRSRSSSSGARTCCSSRSSR